MAIAPLQIPQLQAVSAGADFSPLMQIGELYRQSEQRQKLAALGQDLAGGTVDYRQAAGRAADMGDINSTLKFLALAEQRKKQEDELTAGQDFLTGIGKLYGGGPAAPAPAVGVPQVTAPAPSARAPVASTPKVWGDEEAEKAGFYPPKATQVAQAPVAQPQAGAPAQASNGLPSGITPRAMLLIAGSSSPRLGQAQRESAKILLTHELDAGKATPDMKEWAFAKMQDPNTPDYTTWMRANKAAGKTEVNVDTKGETEFEKQLGGGQAKRWNGYIKEGQAAERKLVDINAMREISQRIGQQGVTAGLKEAIGPYADALGVPIEGLSDIQAYSSIIQRLAPQQRAEGSGSTSDIEFKGMLKSLPTLMQNPAARDATLNTMEALARDDVSRGEIASRLASKEINRVQAEKELRALPDPMKAFSDWRKANPDLYGQALKHGNAAPAPTAAPRKSNTVQQFTPTEVDESLANARAAIAAGKPRDAVIKRLRDAGIDTSGL